MNKAQPNKYWQCHMYRGRNLCKVRAILDEDGRLLVRGKHCHPPDHELNNPRNFASAQMPLDGYVRFDTAGEFHDRAHQQLV